MALSLPYRAPGERASVLRYLVGLWLILLWGLGGLFFWWHPHSLELTSLYWSASEREICSHTLPCRHLERRAPACSESCSQCQSLSQLSLCTLLVKEKSALIRLALPLEPPSLEAPPGWKPSFLGRSPPFPA